MIQAWCNRYGDTSMHTHVHTNIQVGPRSRFNSGRSMWSASQPPERGLSFVNSQHPLPRSPPGVSPRLLSAPGMLSVNTQHKRNGSANTTSGCDCRCTPWLLADARARSLSLSLSLLSFSLSFSLSLTLSLFLTHRHALSALVRACASWPARHVPHPPALASCCRRARGVAKAAAPDRGSPSRCLATLTFLSGVWYIMHMYRHPHMYTYIIVYSILSLSLSLSLSRTHTHTHTHTHGAQRGSDVLSSEAAAERAGNPVSLSDTAQPPQAGGPAPGRRSMMQSLQRSLSATLSGQPALSVRELHQRHDNGGAWLQDSLRGQGAGVSNSVAGAGARPTPYDEGARVSSCLCLCPALTVDARREKHAREIALRATDACLASYTHATLQIYVADSTRGHARVRRGIRTQAHTYSTVYTCTSRCFHLG